MKLGPETKIDTKRQEKLHSFDRLLTIMDQLRENCPWDKKQTFESLRHLTIEETYELSESIIENDFEEIKKELGDLMLHIVFYARLGDESRHFDMADILNGICEKLIRRHPHIYGDTKVENEEDVKRNWEKIKLTEKNNLSVLGGVPKSLPPLLKAVRIQQKAKAVGFDWEDKSQVWDKVQEELNEFYIECNTNFNKEKATQEFGDLLFSLINFARFIDINPEDALEKTNNKFINRFQYLENELKTQNKNIKDISLKEMEDIWQQSKSLY